MTSTLPSPPAQPRAAAGVDRVQSLALVSGWQAAAITAATAAAAQFPAASTVAAAAITGSSASLWHGSAAAVAGSGGGLGFSAGTASSSSAYVGGSSGLGLNSGNGGLKGYAHGGYGGSYAPPHHRSSRPTRAEREHEKEAVKSLARKEPMHFVSAGVIDPQVGHTGFNTMIWGLGCRAGGGDSAARTEGAHALCVS